MRFAVYSLAALLAAGSAAPAALHAQAYRYEVGANLGPTWWTEPANSDVVGDRGIGLAPGLTLGAQGQIWPGPDWGFRLDAGYAFSRVTQLGPAAVVDPDPTDAHQDLRRGVRLWNLTAAAMLHLEDWHSIAGPLAWRPGILVGIGLQAVAPEAHQAYDPSVPDSDRVDGIAFTAGGHNWLLPRSTQAAFLGGVTADVGFGSPVVVHVVLSDRMFVEPVYSLTERASRLVRTSKPGNVGRLMHGFRLTIGAGLRLGSTAPHTAPAPPPPPPRPEPMPEPLPAPGEHITVCAVDPAASDGLSVLQGLYRPNSQDTVVQLGGNQVPLRDALPPVAVASDAPWYLAGRPLSLIVGADTTLFVAYSGPRQVPAEALAFLGTIAGVPAYADRRELASVRDVWNAARDAVPDRSLEALLASSPSLQPAFDSVSVLYLPLGRTGCVFRAFARAGRAPSRPGAAPPDGRYEGAGLSPAKSSMLTSRTVSHRR
jgi:hypothetical protein